MGLGKIVKGAGVIAAVVMAVGLMSPAAMADTTAPEGDLRAEYADGAFDAPEGVDPSEWDDALSVAQDQYGDGDKAYVEAMQEVAPRATTWCNRKTAIFYGGTTLYYLPEFSGATSSTFNCVLEQGSSGPGVSELQLALKNCHGKSIAVDGSFGPATYNALMQVQASAGLAVDGVYGPNTRRKINWYGGPPCRSGLTLLGY